MRRWIVGVSTAVLLITVVTVWVLLIQQPRERYERLRSDFDAIEMPSRWQIAEGLRPIEDHSLIPTSDEALEIRYQELPPEPPPEPPAEPAAPGQPARGRTMVDEDGLHPRMFRAAANPTISARIRHLAGGSFGTHSEAGTHLDYVITLAIAHTLNDDDECLTAFVDALRMAQAADPVPRYAADHFQASERQTLRLLESRIATCAERATPNQRRRLAEALDRIEATRPSLVANQVHARAEVDLEQLGRVIESGSLLDRRRAVEHVRPSIEAAMVVLRHRGWLTDLPREVRDLLEMDLQVATMREQWLRLEYQLLKGLLRHLSGEPIDGLVDPHDGSPLAIRGDAICSTTFRPEYGRDGCIALPSAERTVPSGADRERSPRVTP